MLTNKKTKKSTDRPSVSLLMPVLNEKKNIPVLISRLRLALHGLDYEIIFIDDDSQDKSWQCIQHYARSDKRIRLIRRIGRRGLSSAISEGLSMAQGNHIAVMDADLQHDTSILPRMLNSLSRYEFAIATRAPVARKRTSRERFLLFRSSIATWLVRVLLRVRLSDPLSGYFAFRRSAYDRTKHLLKPMGFKFLLDLYVKADPVKVHEVRYVFGDRLHGKSKLTSAVMLAFLAQLAHLFLYRISNFFKRSH
ncbi:MAG: glycosyltransferase [archaeon]